MANETVFLDHFHISWTTILSVVSLLITVPLGQRLLRFLKWFRHIQHVRRAVSKLPGDEGHWLWGNILQFPGPNEKGIAWSFELLKKYPKYSKFFVGWWRPQVVFRHPDYVKLILKTSEPKSMSGGGGYTLLKPWLGDGLLLSSGPKWFRNRKLLTPGFHFDVLKPYMAINNGAVDTLIGKWEKACASGSSVEIYNSVSLCTLDVMMRCAFSYETDIQLLENDYVKSVNGIAELILSRAIRPWLYIDKLYYNTVDGKRFKKLCDYTHRVASDLIGKRREALKIQPEDEEKKRYVDFLDILLLAKDEKGEGLTHEEIRHEVDTFLFEGHDTTASAISWILYALAMHPDIQQQCRDEVNSVIEAPDKAYMDWDSMQKVPFLTQCVKEGLRLFSPVPFVMRELTSPIEFDGHVIPKGTSINVLIFSVHHNPLVWGDDHMEFKPERFHPDNMQKMDSHAFIPFSAGPRNCIGQNFAMHEIKVVVGRVLQHFELTVDENHPIERMPMMVVRAKNGIKLYMKPLH